MSAVCAPLLLQLRPASLVFILFTFSLFLFLFCVVFDVNGSVVFHRLFLWRFRLGFLLLYGGLVLGVLDDPVPYSSANMTKCLLFILLELLVLELLHRVVVSFLALNLFLPVSVPGHQLLLVILIDLLRNYLCLDKWAHVDFDHSERGVVWQEVEVLVLLGLGLHGLQKQQVVLYIIDLAA